MKQIVLTIFTLLNFSFFLNAQSSGIIAIGNGPNPEQRCGLIDCSTGYFGISYSGKLPAEPRKAVTDSLIKHHPETIGTPFYETFDIGEVAVVYEIIRRADDIEKGCKKRTFFVFKGKTEKEARENAEKRKTDWADLISFEGKAVFPSTKK